MAPMNSMQIALSGLIHNNPEIGNHINDCITCLNDWGRYADGICDLMRELGKQVDKGSDINSIMRVDSITGSIQKSIKQRIAENHQ